MGVRDWLRWANLGDNNPFEALEAGSDPELSRYLVRHDVFDLLWQDQPTIVYAPAGGGKSAFRVRLAWACRVGEDGRQVFAIPYIAPEPDATTLEEHLAPILSKAARELLLMIVYRPERLLDLGPEGRQSVRRVLDQNDPGLVARFLTQLRRAGEMTPLVEGHDASAARLTDPPKPDVIGAVCDVLDELPESREVAPAEERFESLLKVLGGVLGFASVYLLLDGIDAWVETRHDAQRAVAVLTPLLRQSEAWAARGVYLKLFLPQELRKRLSGELTKDVKSAIIRWDSSSCAEVLHRRLLAASGGRIGRLNAPSLSTPGLVEVEEELLRAIPASPTPRELLVLVNRVIEEHVRAGSQESRLEPEDVQAAIRWYRRQPRRSSP